MADTTNSIDLGLCPVCEASVPLSVIEKHVDNCLRKSCVKQDKSIINGKDTRKDSLAANTSPSTSSSKSKKRQLPISSSNMSPKQPKLQPSSPKAVSFHSSTASATATVSSSIPLYETMRPSCIDDFIGHEDIMGKGSIMKHITETGSVPSMILWGPPGCGKTTLARIIAGSGRSMCNMRFVQLSATTSGITDVKEAVKIAKNDRKMFRKGTVLFIDEIHRFNKLQQDSFLPHIEDGTIILLGATTENPSFNLNSALLSRCRVIVMDKLSTDNIQSILQRVLKTINVSVDYKKGEDTADRLIDPMALKYIAEYCDGDARTAINSLHLAVQLKNTQKEIAGSSSKTNVIDIDDVKKCLQRSHVLYDKSGDEHYNLISALIKSMRGSDPSASLYWLARMLTAGEDPLYVARRIVVFASEDIGMADPHALNQAVAAFHACHFNGMPECELNLSQAVIYMARANKSRDVIDAYHKAKKAITDHKGPLPPVPLHLRNAPTKLMKELGYGRKSNDSIDDNFLPLEMSGCDFFSTTQ